MSRHESWIDRQIREAAERGEFDNLPGAGKPIPNRNELVDADWWIKQWIEREEITGPAQSRGRPADLSGTVRCGRRCRTMAGDPLELTDRHSGVSLRPGILLLTSTHWELWSQR